MLKGYIGVEDNLDYASCGHCYTFRGSTQVCIVGIVLAHAHGGLHSGNEAIGKGGEGLFKCKIYIVQGTSSAI